jgi:DNA mismatch repair protein MutL
VLKETPWLKKGAQPPRPAAPEREVVASTRAGSSEAVAVPPSADNEAAAPIPSTVSEKRVAEVRELLVNYQPRPQSQQQVNSSPFKWNEGPASASSKSEAVNVGQVAQDESKTAASPLDVTAQAVELAGVAGAGAGVAGAGEAETTEREAAGECSDGYFSSLSVIGQFNASYILCQQGTDLILVDQHAAHERVAFERLKGEFANKEVDSQGLLFPETMELSYREAAVLKEHLEELARLGFELEEFGGNTWLLKGVPQVLAAADYLRIVRDILEELGSLGRSRTFTDIQEDILARLACHSVVRGRRSLTPPEIAALFRQMDQTDFSSNCPHGRPVMQKITLAEVEKMFKRV